MRARSAPAGAAWIHVMNRVDPCRRLLRSAGDAGAFLEMAAAACAEARVELHAYCLLDRHYHLLTRAVPDALRGAISVVEMGRSFVTRPRLVPLRYGRPVVEVSRYIHLNPVLAGLAWRPEDWPHSSYRAYLGDSRAPAWLRTASVLGRFGSIGARHRYRDYVLAGLDPGSRDGAGRPRWRGVLGCGGIEEETARGVGPARLPIAALARIVAEAFDVPAEMIRSRGAGGRRGALARGALLLAARVWGGVRLREVAGWMGYASPATAVAAALRFEAAAREDPELGALFARVGRRVTPADPVPRRPP